MASLEVSISDEIRQLASEDAGAYGLDENFNFWT